MTSSSSLNPTQRIEVHSDTLIELFDGVAHQVLLRFINPSEVGEALREKIVLEADRPEILLGQWVSTLIEFLHDQKMVFGQFNLDLKIDSKKHCTLTVEALGELLDVQRHQLSQDPAFVRCQSARLRKDSQKYHAEIVLSK